MKLFKSRTTQNIAVSGGLVVGVLTFLRKLWPDLFAWGAETDLALQEVLTVVLIPLLSRLLAFARTPEKAQGE